ncbi:MAG: hypothetical protein P1U74_01890 [Legionellaceae bacterium]|nr:hypothetical protein [Legionellaceae bacterium]
MENKFSNISDYYQRQVRFEEIVTDSDFNQDLTRRYPGIQRLTILGNNYYTIPANGEETARMGASDKVLLVSENKVRSELAGKTDDEKVKLTPDSMIKLEKPLNEIMALGLSKNVFGLKTATATMISYEGAPALFIPFDDMKELSTVSCGVESVRSDGKVVHNDSSVKPIGEGLQSNLFIDDFGDSFGLMYLCGDADAVGGYSQNKGLQGRSLYVFDQAIITHDFPYVRDLFNIDSSFRQTPSTAIGARIRHTNGRNFSLIEDASLRSKYDSLSEERLQSAQQYCDDVLKDLKSKTTSVPRESLQAHYTLINSAKNIKGIIKGRIDKFNKAVPRFGDENQDMVKNILVLEGALNKPRLFTKDGRPSRHPVTTGPHKLKVLKIEKIAGGYKLKFNKALSKEQTHSLVLKLGRDNVKPTSRTWGSGARDFLQISDKQLENIDELLYPEQNCTFKVTNKYFEYSRLQNIAQNYGVSNQVFKNVTSGYRSREVEAVTNMEIMSNLETTRREFNELLVDGGEDDRGYICHNIKLLELETQKQLQFMLMDKLDYSQIETLGYAFDTAVKLDCMREFNYFTQTLIKQIQSDNIPENITEFLDKYSSLDETTMTLDEAKKFRREMLNDIREIITASLNSENYLVKSHDSSSEHKKEFKARYNDLLGRDEDPNNTKDDEDIAKIRPSN